MGILDDAIREHLELKRQHGADSDDVERLEKEAFGPPTRPGDPEFDTSEAEAAGAAPAQVSEAPTTVSPESSSQDEPPSEATPPSESAGAGLFDAETDESDEDWLASLEDVVEPPALEQDAAPSPHMPTESVEQPLPPRSSGSDPATSESALPTPESAGDSDEDPTPAEEARIEHAELGDTVAHEVIPDPAAAPETGEEPVPSEPGTDPGAADSEPPEPPESAIFDGDDDLELDLELDIDEAEEASAPSSDDPLAGSGPAVEDPQVGRSVPVEPEPDSEEMAVEPEPTSTEMEIPATGTDEFEADDAEEDELEDEDEDLLEETPDFLQDTPEGDRLWFEQKGPKDFDFDDEDEDED